jgi:hypothetical protein
MAAKPTVSRPDAAASADDGPAFDHALARLIKAASGLPEISVAKSYGTPAIKCSGKLLMRVKDAETVVLVCAIEEKQLLFESAPDIYYETDHYRAWPSLLVRLSEISDEELRLRMENAFRSKAPRRLVAAWEDRSRHPAKEPARRA